MDFDFFYRFIETLTALFLFLTVIDVGYVELEILLNFKQCQRDVCFAQLFGF